MTISSQATNDFRSSFLRIMSERGFIHQCSDLNALDEALTTGPQAGFIGFDATASSLHVGHLLSLMALRWFAATGNKPIALMGGATTLVGDPSFRNKVRPMLSTDEVRTNISSISAQAGRVVSSERLVIENNADWLSGAGLIDFMRDVGSHFTVNRMLAMESVKSRMDDGLTMLEFTYMLLQSADFVELSRRHGCVLQMGGSDQWGNIINGIDLSRRLDGPTLFGLTTPLLTTSGGQKMGKTADGAVWLDPGLLSPDAFWQFWRNVDDTDTERFLALFTELPMNEVRRLAALGGQELNEAKKILANEVTAIVHGREASDLAARSAQALFSGHGEADRTIAASAGIGVLDLLVELDLSFSKGEARRLINGRGVRMDGRVVDDERLIVQPSPRLEIGVGKRRRICVCIE